MKEYVRAIQLLLRLVSLCLAVYYLLYLAAHLVQVALDWTTLEAAVAYWGQHQLKFLLVSAGFNYMLAYYIKHEFLEKNNGLQLSSKSIG